MWFYIELICQPASHFALLDPNWATRKTSPATLDEHSPRGSQVATAELRSDQRSSTCVTVLRKASNGMTRIALPRGCVVVAVLSVRSLILQATRSPVYRCGCRAERNTRSALSQAPYCRCPHRALFSVVRRRHASPRSTRVNVLRKAMNFARRELVAATPLDPEGTDTLPPSKQSQCQSEALTPSCHISLANVPSHEGIA